MKGASLIAVAAGLALLLAIALRTSSADPTDNELIESTGGCYTEGAGPAEPTICS